MKKVVINKCYGGFGLSPQAVKRFAELQGKECHFYLSQTDMIPISEEEAAAHGLFWHAFDTPDAVFPRNSNNSDWWDTHCISRHDIERDDPILIRVVEELGEGANSKLSKLKIVEIPDDVKYIIQEYDGMEWIAEKHRTWE